MSVLLDLSRLVKELMMKIPPTDIIDHVRAVYKPSGSDGQISLEYIQDLIAGGHPNIQIISVGDTGAGTLDSLYPTQHEPDVVIISGTDIEPELIGSLIYHVFEVFDCTGCCDAITHVHLAYRKVLIIGKIGKTYHS